MLTGCWTCRSVNREGISRRAEQLLAIQEWRCCMVVPSTDQWANIKKLLNDFQWPLFCRICHKKITKFKHSVDSLIWFTAVLLHPDSLMVVFFLLLPEEVFQWRGNVLSRDLNIECEESAVLPRLLGRRTHNHTQRMLYRRARGIVDRPATSTWSALRRRDQRWYFHFEYYRTNHNNNNVFSSVLIAINGTAYLLTLVGVWCDWSDHGNKNPFVYLVCS